VTVHGSGAEISTLYSRLLGASWSSVAEAVRGVHAARPIACSHGRVRVTNGPAPLARILARMLWLPRPGDAVDTRLVVNAAAGEEQWVRTFDGRRLDTRQYLATGGELAERYGAFEFRFRLELSGGGIAFRQVGAAVWLRTFRLRLPSSCAPRVTACEEPAGEHDVAVHVLVELPLLGPVLAYDGTIAVEAPV
jgi:hypothetical protein